jgi:hypothetical protein
VDTDLLRYDLAQEDRTENEITADGQRAGSHTHHVSGNRRLKPGSSEERLEVCSASARLSALHDAAPTSLGAAKTCAELSTVSTVSRAPFAALQSPSSACKLTFTSHHGRS